MRLNLGCGNRKLEGWVNVDREAACKPDRVADLEKLPWPWPDDSAEEVMLSHVLEHLGADPKVYLGIVKELYRVCRDGAKITIVVPHHRHDHFLDDPTHVRAVTVGGLDMLSQASCKDWIARGGANTPLAIYLGVDFTIQSVTMLPTKRWQEKVQSGAITKEQLHEAAETHNNVISTMTVELKAIKPAGRLTP
jgi:hypothetical protein